MGQTGKGKARGRFICTEESCEFLVMSYELLENKNFVLRCAFVVKIDVLLLK
jgi:hypothetical protein